MKVKKCTNFKGTTEQLVRPAKGAVFSGWESRLERLDQPPVANPEHVTAMLRVKQGELGDRVIRHFNLEISQLVCRRC